MSDHYAVIKPATRPYRVFLADELIVETQAVLELTEHFGGQVAPAVPYFAPEATTALDLTPSDATSRCPLKGEASYFALRGVADAVWVYRQPNEGVEAIAGHFGFDTSKGFRIES